MTGERGREHIRGDREVSMCNRVYPSSSWFARSILFRFETTRQDRGRGYDTYVVLEDTQSDLSWYKLVRTGTQSPLRMLTVNKS
jgi:hypothetical protein